MNPGSVTAVGGGLLLIGMKLRRFGQKYTGASIFL
jgi:hypothetical protein